MKPIEFKEQNCTFAEKQPEYLPLPAYRVEELEGRVFSCWYLSLDERLTILFRGRLWVSLMSFNKPLTPSFFTVEKRDLFMHTERKTKKIIKKNIKLFNKLKLSIN